MQEKAEGPGQFFVKAGGDYIVSTYDTHITIVGDEEKNPGNKIEVVSDNNIVSTKEFYFNKADVHAFLADSLILLMAGKDVRQHGSDEMGPGIGPVLILGPKGVTISDRVFASASPDAQCVSIFMLTPFHTNGDQ